MLDDLKYILKIGTLRRFEQYDWNGLTYVRVFIVGQKDYAWDGLRTSEAMLMLDAAQDQKKRSGR